VVFQGDAANSPGSVYFDDLMLTQVAGGPYGNWNIVWSDEFNGTSISTNNWVFNAYNIGNGQGGWGNNELEYYTTTSAYVSNGLLNIMVYTQPYDGYNYPSAKLI